MKDKLEVTLTRKNMIRTSENNRYLKTLMAYKICNFVKNKNN